MAVHTEQLGAEFIVEGMVKFVQAMNRADTAMDDVEKTGGTLSTMIGTTLATALGGVLVNAASAAFNALVKVGGAAAGFVAEGFEMAVDFQDSLVGLELAAGATGLTFDQLHDAAIAVGGDTRLLGVSASGASEAMTGLFKAGLTEAQVLGDLNGYVEEGTELTGALRASIDLAAASELDMVQAADLASIVISSFGDDAKDAGIAVEDWIVGAMDHMVRTADGSVASVSGLQEALINVGPTAAGAGQNLEDVNTALGVLSMKGIEGSMAGTNLASMMNSLRDTTPQAEEALDGLGIKVRDIEGNMLPLPALIAEFELGLYGLTSAEKDAALGAVFTSNGLKIMDVLVGEGTEGFNDMRVAIGDASTMMEQAGAKAETYAGKMEAFEGTMETLKIQIGEALLPVATQFLEWIAELVENYGPLMVSLFESLGMWLSNIAEQFSFLLAYLGFVVEEGDVLNDWLAEFPEWAQPFVEMLGNIVMKFIEAIGVFQETGSILDVLGVLFGDWLPTAIGVASEFFTTVLLPAAMASWAFISGVLIPIIVQLWTWIAANLPPVIQTLADFFNTVLLPAINVIWAFIQDKLIPIMIAGAEVMGAVLGVAIEVLTTLWKSVLLPILQTVWEFIKGSIIPIIEAVAQVMGAVLGVAITALTGIWENVLLPAIQEFHEFFLNKIKPILEKGANEWFPKLRGAIDRLVGPISSVVGWLGKLASKIASIKLPDWMQPGSPPPLFYALEDIAKGLKKVASETVTVKTKFAGLPEMPLSASLPIASLRGPISPLAPVGATNNSNVTNTNNFDQSRVVNQNFVVTPQVMLETVGGVAF